MGLDTYIFSVENPKDGKETPDVIPADNFDKVFTYLPLKEEAYWRKNYFINSYVGDLYNKKRKGDLTEFDFNTVYVKVTYEDIKKLKRQINTLPHSSWELNSLDPKKYPTIRLLRGVLREIKDNAGKRTFYIMSNW